MLNQLTFKKDGAKYFVNDDNAQIASVIPGAVLGNYCVLLIMENQAISYSVVTTDSSICSADVIDQLLDTFRKINVKFSVLIRGIVGATILGAVAALTIGTTTIGTLHLHKVDGQEFYFKDSPDTRYWVGLNLSGLVTAENVNTLIVLLDIVNLRHVFGKQNKMELTS